MNESWPWYVSGPLIGLTFFVLTWTGRSFGISSVFEKTCAIATGNRIFSYEKSKDGWRLLFALGIILGGFIGAEFLTNEMPMFPSQLFDPEIASVQDILIFSVLGGFLVGFGTRYAGGCTSGHAITGLATFQLPSLIAVIGFFIGGLVMHHLILPELL